MAQTRAACERQARDTRLALSNPNWAARCTSLGTSRASGSATSFAAPRMILLDDGLPALMEQAAVQENLRLVLVAQVLAQVLDPGG